MRLSEIHPLLYHLRIQQQRGSRHLQDFFSRIQFAKTIYNENLPFTCKKHQSLLRRRLGSSDPQLQENKITNLKIATATIDGLLIHPGETFSFWKRVGKTTRKKGYIEGMLLSRGEVITGVGGGICQLANLLYWMAFHTPLQITEWHHHSFDPFPDDHRTLPFGSGAGVFYNYVDLRFYNPTERTFQIRTWVTDQHLKGAIHIDREWPFSYHIEERNHRFVRRHGKNFRQNEIWRRVIDKQTGNKIKEERLIQNFAEVKYELAEVQIQDGRKESNVR